MNRKKITKAVACSLCGVMAMTSPMQSIASSAKPIIAYTDENGMQYSDYTTSGNNPKTGYAVALADSSSVVDGKLTIPETVNGKSVIYLESGFMSNSGASVVSLPKSIVGLSSDAFFEAKDLEQYEIQDPSRNNLLAPTDEDPALYWYKESRLIDYPSAASHGEDYKVRDATTTIYSMDNATFGTLDLNNTDTVSTETFAGTKVDKLIVSNWMQTKTANGVVDFAARGLHAKSFEVRQANAEGKTSYLRTDGKTLYTTDGKLLKIATDATDIDWTKYTFIAKDAFDTIGQYQELYNQIPSNLRQTMKNTVYQFYNQNNSVFMVNGNVGFCFNFDKQVPDSVEDINLPGGVHGNFSELGSDKYDKVRALMFVGVPYDGTGLFEKTFGCSYEDALRQIQDEGMDGNAALNAVASMVHEVVSGKSISQIEGIGIECFTQSNVETYIKGLSEAVNNSEKYTFNPVFQLSGDELTFREQEDGTYLSDEFAVYAYNGEGEKTNAYTIDMTLTSNDFAIYGSTSKTFSSGQMIRLTSATQPSTDAASKNITFAYSEGALDYYNPAQGDNYQHVLVSATNTKNAEIPYTIVLKPRVSLLTISKKAVTGTDELPGAELKLTKKDDQSVVEAWTSGQTAHTINMPEDGTYVLTETTAPDGYQVAESIEFVITNGTVIGDWTDDTVVMYDAPNPKEITISKKDITSKEELPGAVLTVTNQGGTTVDTWTSTTTPHVIRDLADGTYTLTETTAPSGYDVAESIEFQVVNGVVEGGMVTMYDAPIKRDTVAISKQDITNNTELPGASLVVKNEKNEEVEAWVSTTTPHEIKNLPDGTYTLTEITAPAGYEVAESITFTITNGVASTKDIVMYDKPEEKENKKVEISKRDITNQAELPGAKLQILNNDKEVVKEWTSTEAPYSVELPDGTYTLKEITAPDGYEVAEEVIFTVKDGEAIGGTVIMYDAPTEEKDTSFTISKRDITNGKELEGASLKIVDSEGKTVETWISGKKPHEVVNLKNGEYTLIETTAPDGYEVAEEINFTVKDGTVENGGVVMYDSPSETPDKPATPSEPEKPSTPSEPDKPDKPDKPDTPTKEDTYFYISKRDATNSNELPGAKLKITDSNGDIVASWTSTTSPHKVTNLTDGTYTLTEITAPDGYDVAESITFTVTNGTVEGQTVVMYDKPTSKSHHSSGGGGGGGSSSRRSSGGSNNGPGVTPTPVVTPTPTPDQPTPTDTVTVTPTPEPTPLPKTADASAFSAIFMAAAIVMLGVLADKKKRSIF